MAGISYGDGSTERSISALYYQDGSTRRAIKAAWIGDGSTKRKVFDSYTPVSASVSPTSLTGSGTGAVVTTTLAAVVSAAGGTGSYTFSWEIVSGDDRVQPVDPNSATTKFRANKGVGTYVTVYRCKVSDGTSSAYSGNVTITLTD